MRNPSVVQSSILHCDVLSFSSVVEVWSDKFMGYSIEPARVPKIGSIPLPY
jgi:hypothetical protein